MLKIENGNIDMFISGMLYLCLYLYISFQNYHERVVYIFVINLGFHSLIDKLLGGDSEHGKRKSLSNRR